MKKKLTLNMETVRNLEDSDVNTVVGGASFVNLSVSIRVDSSISDSSSITNSFSQPPATESCPPPFTESCPEPPQTMFCPDLSFRNLSETIIIGGGGGGWRQR